MTVGRRPDPLRLVTWSPGDRKVDIPATIDPSELEIPASIAEITSKPNYALDMWTYLYAALSTANILEASDRYALELACLTYAQYRIAQKAYEAAPMTTGALGQDKRSPYYDVMAGCRSELRKQLVEFGLTPAARVKLGTLQKGGSGLRGALKAVIG